MEKIDESNENKDNDGQLSNKDDKNNIEGGSFTEAKKTKKSSLQSISLVLILTIIVVAILGGLAFWWRDRLASEYEAKLSARIDSLSSEIVALGKQLNDEKAKNVDSADDEDSDTNDCAPILPSDSAIENIKASITVGNTQPLEGYMASSVNVILAATEAYGMQTPTQASLDVADFLPDPTVTTWDFDLPALVLSSYGSGGYGAFFSNNSLVGKSSDNKVISILFDCEGKINTIFMVSNENEL